MSPPAGPRTGDRGVPIQRATLRRARQLFWPHVAQELLALALIIVTVAAGWLLARH